ncbi:sushi, von Willebrand factor type A, EGF and pentraxin domain-containing protein 1 [Lingula anatina]|uniref:Sushi, von Willebrand factor type A, EGF and pentraxin domain-containing protein 1 n=1 Tax=Lingula anatina TaxID=7574 RepID=A0A1S3JIZ7_LINAN|nr:sushi, von Willebrand factor type A, EGF and pentraxin domain-containing protein 1 [Lingula anatina]|eukprot:XP_013410385.1 sushi, von Willebrand factor type A, EGF and pentraxin domain-containing protein 1 [Lingula anatina]
MATAEILILFFLNIVRVEALYFYANTTHVCNFTVVDTQLFIEGCREDAAFNRLDTSTNYEELLVQQCTSLQSNDAVSKCYGGVTNAGLRYSVDIRNGRIKVTDTQTQQSGVIDINRPDYGHSPPDISVDFERGYLFWSQRGSSPAIVRSSLSGRDRRDIINDVINPTGVAVLQDEQKLVWSDSATGVIKKCSYDGNSCSEILKKPGSFFYGITVSSDVIIAADIENDVIHFINRTSNTVGSFSTVGAPIILGKYDRENATKATVCQTSNTCSGVCIVLSASEECTCRAGLYLNDTRCTGGDEPLLIFSDTDLGKLYKMSTSTPSAFSELPVNVSMGVLALESYGGYIYWSNVEQSGIYRVQYPGDSEPELIVNSTVNPDGLAIDWMSGNLLWTDPWLKRIEVSRLDGSSKRALIYDDIDLPRAIAVEPRSGYMFWTDWSKPAKIERAAVDGTDREVIVNTDIVWPNALTIDYETQRLYWADAWLRKIEVCNYDGLERRLVVSARYIGHPFGLVTYGGRLWWTDWYSRSIGSSNMAAIDDGFLELGPVGLKRPSGVAVLKPGPKGPGSNACSVNNGGCSNLCLPLPTGMACQCPEGKGLQADDRTCEGVARCPDVTLTDQLTLVRHCSPYENSVCSFQCNTGYTLTGQSEITCLESGTWSDTQPTCEIVKCPVMSLPDHVSSNCDVDSRNYGTTCQLSCDTGYRPTVAVTTTCLANGTWDASLSCEVVQCPPLSPSVNGTLTPPLCNNYTVFNDVCSLSCPSGYVVSGQTTVSCLASAQWNADLGTCKDTQKPSFNGTCPQNPLVYISDTGTSRKAVNWTSIHIEAVDNSNILPSVSYKGKQDTYSEGDHQVEINATDNSGNSALCVFTVTVTVPRCPSPPPPPHGAIAAGCSLIHGSVCTVTCDTGYMVPRNNTDTLQCVYSEGNTHWDGNPVCKAVTCPVLDTSRGYIYQRCDTDRELPVGTVCELGCDIVYQRSENDTTPTIRCLPTGQWENTTFQCIAPKCPALTAPNGGTVSPASCLVQGEYGDQCQYQCHEGYQLTGVSSHRCTEFNTWTAQDQTAVCTDVTPPDFGDTCPESDLHFFTPPCGDRASVLWSEPVATDNSGQLTLSKPTYTSPSVLTPGDYPLVYTAQDAANLQKQCRFSLRIRSPSCQPPPDIAGAVLDSTTCSFKFGSVMTYRCQDGYRLQGNATLTCGREGNWVGSVSCAAITCPKLSAVPNAVTSPSLCTSSSVFYATQCDVTCELGYLLKGPRSFTCGSDGAWSNPTGVTECEAIPPPNFKDTCPRDTIVSTYVNKDYTEVTWGVPRAFDSKGRQLSLTVTPLFVVSDTVRLGVGSHRITYTATDSYGLTSTCSFTITVKDQEAPRPLACPDNQIFEARGSETNVQFERPVFEDNVGVITSSCDREWGSFPLGRFEVTCTARDAAGNTGKCVMGIAVVARRCPDIQPPIHGAKACSTIKFTTLCTLHCNDQYEFPPFAFPQPAYTCGIDSGQWLPPLPFLPFTCAARFLPNFGEVNGRIQFHEYEGDCVTAAATAEIRADFQSLLELSIFAQAGLCDDGACEVSSVTVVCNTATGSGFPDFPGDFDFRRRRKRETTPRTRSSVSVDFVILTNATSKISNDTDVTSLKEKLNLLSSSVQEFVESGNLTLNISGTSLTADPKRSVVSPTLKCRPGAVKRDTYCVQCPVGTYYDVQRSDCVECPVSSYQDQEGQLECVHCPGQMTTNDVGSYNASLCIEPTTYDNIVFLGSVAADRDWVIASFTSSAILLVASIVATFTIGWRRSHVTKA